MTLRYYPKLQQGANLANPFLALLIVVSLIFSVGGLGQELAKPLWGDANHAHAAGTAFSHLTSSRLGGFLIVVNGVPLLVMLSWMHWVEGRCGANKGRVLSGVLPLGGGFGVGVVLILVVCLLQYCLAVVEFHQIVWPSGWQAVWPLLILLCGWCTQGAYEEVIFRGYLLSRFAAKWGWWPSVAASSVLFAVAHAFNAHANPIFLLNLVLFSVFVCLLVRRTKTIWHVCGIHAGWNFAQAHLIGRPVSGMFLGHDRVSEMHTAGPAYLSGGPAGLEGSVVTSVIFVGLCVYLLHWERRRVRERA